MQKMKTSYTDEYEHYLVDLYVKAGLSSEKQQYVRKGDIWKVLGFQNHDPASDIRGGGILCLENMLFFFRVHRHAAQSMIKKRADGWDTFETFPWAPASINITRLVASEFSICGPGGQTKSSSSSKTRGILPKTSFHMLLENDGFSRIYVLAFLLLDKVWDEQGATYMQFNAVLESVRKELSEAIALTDELSELEQQIFERVHYIPPPMIDLSVQDDIQTEHLRSSQSRNRNVSDGFVNSCCNPPRETTLRFRHSTSRVTVATV